MTSPAVWAEGLPEAERQHSRFTVASLGMLGVRVAVMVWTAVWMILLCFLLAFYPDGPRRRRVAQRGVQLACRWIVRMSGVRCDWNQPTLPTGALIVANHRSWLDIPIMLAAGGCTFVGKQEVRDWPLIGPLSEALGIIWIDRRRMRDLLNVLPAVEAALQRGERVVLFPEGTTTNGRQVLPFKSGLFEAAVRTGAPVVPVAMTGFAAAGDPDALCWYGTETLVANLPRVLGLRGAGVMLTIEPRVAPVPDRKAMARSAHAAIARQLHQESIAAPR
ncbi:MAG: lysophospholipid acyltransferase family protein [Gemmatimonadaceae bacterium]